MREITDLVTVLDESETNDANNFVLFLVLMIAGAVGVGVSPSTRIIVVVTFGDRDGRLLGIILARRASAAFADIISLAINLGPEGKLLDSAPPRSRYIGIGIGTTHRVLCIAQLSQPFVDAALARYDGSTHATPLPQPLLVARGRVAASCSSVAKSPRSMVMRSRIISHRDVRIPRLRASLWSVRSIKKEL